MENNNLTQAVIAVVVHSLGAELRWAIVKRQETKCDWSPVIKPAGRKKAPAGGVRPGRVGPGRAQRRSYIDSRRARHTDSMMRYCRAGSPPLTAIHPVDNSGESGGKRLGVRWDRRGGEKQRRHPSAVYTVGEARGGSGSTQWRHRWQRERGS